MKKQYLLLLGMFVSLNLSSQETFFKFTTGWTSKNVIELSDKYVVFNTASLTNSNHIPTTNFFNLQGDSLALYYFQIDTVSLDYFFKNSFSSTSNAHYVAEYYQESISERFRGLLVKYNQDYSDTLSTKIFDIGTNGSILQLCTAKNDTSLILGFRSRNGNNNIYATFLESDTLGNIRWQKNFYCAGNMMSFHILPTRDNGFIFTCLEDRKDYNGAIVDVKTSLIKTDSVGNLQWRHTWGGDSTRNIGSWVVPLDDGNFLYAWTDNDFSGWNYQSNPQNTIRFAKFDIEGNIIWIKDCSDYFQEKYYRISQMELMPDGNIILAVNNFTWGGLIKIDQDANMIWHRENMMPPGLSYEENDASLQHMHIKGVTCTSDGGLILAGEYLSGPGNMFPDLFQSAYVYKLDEYGCYEPGCHVGIEEPQVSVKETANVLKLYPNPAQDYFTVEYALSTMDKPMVLKITNIQGKVLYAKWLQYQQDQLLIDASTYIEGVYYISLFAGQKLIKTQSVQINK